jgi:hypothetical protein
MKAQKKLLSIAVIVCLCSLTASALDISVSIGNHGHAHGRKIVILPSPHRSHCGPRVIHAPHVRRRICEPIRAKSYIRRPIGHYRFRWQHPQTVIHRPCTKRSILMAPPTHIVRRPTCVSILTIWITNSNGSKTPVKLQRRGAGYVGPKGEYYCSMPTHRQLRVLYGF